MFKLGLAGLRGSSRGQTGGNKIESRYPTPTVSFSRKPICIIWVSPPAASASLGHCNISNLGRGHDRLDLHDLPDNILDCKQGAASLGKVNPPVYVMLLRTCASNLRCSVLLTHLPLLQGMHPLASRPGVAYKTGTSSLNMHAI